MGALTGSVENINGNINESSKVKKAKILELTKMYQHMNENISEECSKIPKTTMVILKEVSSRDFCSTNETRKNNIKSTSKSNVKSKRNDYKNMIENLCIYNYGDNFYCAVTALVKTVKRYGEKIVMSN